MSWPNNANPTLAPAPPILNNSRLVAWSPATPRVSLARTTGSRARAAQDHDAGTGRIHRAFLMHVLPKAFTVSPDTARSPVGIKALAAEIDVRLQLTRESLALHPQPHGGTQRSLRECRYRVVAIANRLSGWWATARLISMVRGFDPNGTRDIVFVPVGINYDHVLEDELLTAGLKFLRPRS